MRAGSGEAALENRDRDAREEREGREVCDQIRPKRLRAAVARGAAQVVTETIAAEEGRRGRDRDHERRQSEFPPPDFVRQPRLAGAP